MKFLENLLVAAFFVWLGATIGSAIILMIENITTIQVVLNTIIIFGGAIYMTWFNEQ